MSNKTWDAKYGKVTAFEVSCIKCNETVTVYEREYLHPKKEKYFCSIKCSNSHPRSDEQKQKVRETMLAINSCNVYFKTCPSCKMIFTTQRKHQKCCSRTCGAKSRIKRNRCDGVTLKQYRYDCSFKFSLNDFPDEFDFTLIETHGWYSAPNRGNNFGGVSRDHMVSVRYGYDNNIDSDIISHPANCQLLLQSENASKCNKNAIPVEYLMKRINDWDLKYNTPVDKIPQTI